MSVFSDLRVEIALSHRHVVLFFLVLIINKKYCQYIIYSLKPPQVRKRCILHTYERITDKKYHSLTLFYELFI